MEKITKKSRKVVRPLLPDDIIMQILIRMPVDRVLKYRRVCRRWKDLISSQWFADMHLKSNASSPGILFQKNGKLFQVDKWEASRKRTRIRKLGLELENSGNKFSYWFILSYDGLILLKGQDYCRKVTDFIILNPITGDKVSTMGRIPEVEKGKIYGMFYHPQIKEYCVVCGLIETVEVKLKLISLGSKSCCRDLKPHSSWVNRVRRSGLHVYNVPPVVIEEDAKVYWMLGHSLQLLERRSCEELIMGFDIKKEQFFMIPHPCLTSNDCLKGHLSMNILKMDGRLSFVHSTYSRGPVIINIWSLQDSATGIWIKQHSISIDCLKQVGGELRNRGELRAMAVGNGELLMQFWFKGSENSCGKRFYACNLELRKIRKFGNIHRFEGNMHVHFPSFISPETINCQQEIMAKKEKTVN